MEGNAHEGTYTQKDIHIKEHSYGEDIYISYTAHLLDKKSSKRK